MTTISMAERRAAEKMIENASFRWPLAVDTGYSRGRVQCPDCGASGWPGGRWTHCHLEHVACECGRTVTVRGLAMHEYHHRKVLDR